MSITVSFKTEHYDDEDRPIGPVVVIDHDLYDTDPEIVKRRREGGTRCSQWWRTIATSSPGGMHPILTSTFVRAP